MRRYLFIALVFCYPLVGKTIIDCRVITNLTTACNPYSKRLHYVQEVTYEADRKKLIISKTLPKPEEHISLKVISVDHMVQRHVKIEEPIRYKSLKKEEIQKRAKEPTLVLKSPVPLKPKQHFSEYVVVKGDSLSKIAAKLDISVQMLRQLNQLKQDAMLRIGQKLRVPFEKRVVEGLMSGEYRIQKGDSLLSIAKMFKLQAKDIVLFNQIKHAKDIKEGRVLKLPLPYVMAKLEKKESYEERGDAFSRLDLNAFGRHKLRVTATAYTSHSNQTDDTPFLAAWNNRLRPGMKAIAVSRDLLSKYGMRNGTKVRISGLRGFYRVRDKMNKRYKKRIDIYMGLDLKKALKWGKRSVMIYW